MFFMWSYIMEWSGTARGSAQPVTSALRLKIKPYGTALRLMRLRKHQAETELRGSRSGHLEALVAQ